MIFIHKRNKKVYFEDALWGLRKLKPKPFKNRTDFESEDYGFFEDEVMSNKPIPKYIIDINKGKYPNKIYNHMARYNNKRDIELYKRLPIGGKATDPSIEDIMPYKSRNHIFKDKFFKLIPDKPCKTITSHMKFDCHMYIHPYENRAITPREAARVQSFPDNYVFKGAYTKWYMQIGNSVPPLLSDIIAYSILKKGLKNGH